MNKRAILKFIMIFLATAISIYFMSFSVATIGIESIPTILLILMISITLFMYYKKNIIKNNKIKFVYDVILLLLIFFSSLLLLWIIYNFIYCIFSTSCSFSGSEIGLIPYMITIFFMILLSIDDIFYETDKKNDYLTMLVTVIILLVHLNYYFNPRFKNTNTFLVQESYIYVEQNYIYFFLLYAITIINKLIKKAP